MSYADNAIEDIAPDVMNDGMRSAIYSLGLSDELQRGTSPLDVLEAGLESIDPQELIRAVAYEIARSAASMGMNA